MEEMTFYYSLKPLFFLQTIFGMRWLPSHHVLSCVHSVFMLFALIIITGYVIREKIDKFYIYFSRPMILTDLFTLVIQLMTSLCNISVHLFQSSRSYKSYTAKSIDNHNKLGFVGLPICHVGRHVVIKVILLTLLSLLFLCSFDFYAISTFNNKINKLLLIKYLFYMINSLVFIHFILSMFFTTCAFFSVNLKIQYHYNLQHQDYFCKENWKKDVTQYYKSNALISLIFPWKMVADKVIAFHKTVTFDLDQSMEVYKDLCRQSKCINSFFGIQNLLVTITGIVSVIRSLFYASNYGLHKVQYTQEASLSSPLLAIISACAFAVYDISALVLMAAACEMVVDEAKKTSWILDTLLVVRKHIKDRERMEMWANQVPLCYPQFTACKLFTIDLTILSSLAATIATYLVVLMQL